MLQSMGRKRAKGRPVRNTLDAQAGLSPARQGPVFFHYATVLG